MPAQAQTMKGTVESVRKDGTAFKLNGDWFQRSQYGYSGPAFDGLYQQNVIVQANPGKQGGYFATSVKVVKEPGELGRDLSISRQVALKAAVEGCHNMAMLQLSAKPEGALPVSWAGTNAILAMASAFEEWLTRQQDEDVLPDEEPPPDEEGE